MFDRSRHLRKRRSPGTPNDPDDDTELSFELIKGSTGRSDDFCEVVTPALT